MTDRLTIRERVFGRIEGSVEDRTLTPGDVPAPLFQWSPGGSVTPTTALTIADAYACIRALSDAAASLPLQVFRRTDAGRERVRNRTAELIERPAPALTTANLIGQLVAHLNLDGNAYLAKYRRAGGIEQLGLLAPERVAVAVEGGEPVYKLTHTNGAQTRHGTDDVIHIKALSTDGLVGLSPVRQCRAALGLAESLTKHAQSFFENDATPRGLLKLQRFGDADAQVAALRDDWEGTRNTADPDEPQYGTHRGTANAHRIAVVSGEVDFTPISMNPEDAQFLQQRKLSAVETARIFRVPPHLIGADPGSSLTYQTAETAALDFAKFSLRPWLTVIEQAISADADLCPGPRYVEFAMDAILRADSATRASVYTAALDPITGWMSRDEVRRLENLPAEGPVPAPTRVVANGNGADPVKAAS